LDLFRSILKQKKETITKDGDELLKVFTKEYNQDKPNLIRNEILEQWHANMSVEWEKDEDDEFYDKLAEFYDYIDDLDYFYGNSSILSAEDCIDLMSENVTDEIELQKIKDSIYLIPELPDYVKEWILDTY